jgi:hypothetical protein
LKLIRFNEKTRRLSLPVRLSINARFRVRMDDTPHGNNHPWMIIALASNSMLPKFIYYNTLTGFFASWRKVQRKNKTCDRKPRVELIPVFRVVRSKNFISALDL